MSKNIFQNLFKNPEFNQEKNNPSKVARLDDLTKKVKLFVRKIIYGNKKTLQEQIEIARTNYMIDELLKNQILEQKQSKEKSQKSTDSNSNSRDDSQSLNSANIATMAYLLMSDDQKSTNSKYSSDYSSYSSSDSDSSSDSSSSSDE